MLRKKPILTARYKLIILMMDLLFFLIAAGTVFSYRAGELNPNIWSALGVWFIGICLVGTLYILGGYDLEGNEPYYHLVLRQVVSVVIVLGLVVLVNYFLGKERAGIFGRGILVGSLLVFIFVSILYRYFIWKQFGRFRESLNWLFILDDKSYVVIHEELKKMNFLGNVLFLLNEPTKDHVGSWKELESELDKSWSAIIVGLHPSSMTPELVSTLMGARLAGNFVLDLSEFYEMMWRKVPVEYLQPYWFVFEKGFYLLSNPFGSRLKRLTDVFLSILLFLITWPIILLAMIMIGIDSKGPIFYRQTRTGKNNEPFSILKFRSMTVNAEAKGAQWAQANDSRVTRVGRWIRLTRIDELPQLWNVLRGDMSFIGPRPERPEFNEELEKQIPYYRLRYLVRPGISGWAQTRYPYGASIEDAREKLCYDLFYIKNYSLLLDISIILKTVKVVLFGKGR